MGVALCAVMMVVCVMCVFGMGMMGKVAGRWRARSEKKEP
jgi:type II secretory pathway component PulK